MNKTYEYTGIDESVTISVAAGTDMESVGAKAFILSGGVAILPAAGKEPVGIALITQGEPVKKGDDITIQVKDIGFWKAGTEIEVGDLLAVDAEGLCRKASTGQYIYARALGSATEKGDIVNVQIINAGYAV